MKDKEIETLAEHLIKGSDTSEERQKFNDWYNSKNDELVLVPSTHEDEKEETRTRMYNQLESYISSKDMDSDPISMKKPNLTIYLKIAASILIVLSISYIFHQTTSHVVNSEMEKSLAMIEKVTKSGEKSKLRLSDGTIVHLNSESSLVFPEVFDVNGRSVMLKGEAFFEVFRDESRPFTVTSENLLTTVLGTSFNIKAYPDEKREQVWVATGKVKVKNNPNGNEKTDTNNAILTPNEGVIYNSLTSNFEKQKLDIENLIAWKEGWLVFESREFRDVIKSLERWYGVKFKVDDESLMNKKVTLKQQNESLSAVLKVLSYLSGFDYIIEGDNVTIATR